jgi:hypothetical protein
VSNTAARAAALKAFTGVEDASTAGENMCTSFDRLLETLRCMFIIYFLIL